MNTKASKTATLFQFPCFQDDWKESEQISKVTFAPTFQFLLSLLSDGSGDNVQ